MNIQETGTIFIDCLSINIRTVLLGWEADKSNFGPMDQLAQSAQFYFLNSYFNQK